MSYHRKSDSVIKPRNGCVLVVGIVCRISGCANQKEQSLKDQEDHAREIISTLYEGEVEFRVITSIGKGENLKRPELEEIETAFCSGEYDFFVFDDLSRLIRGGEAARLLGIGVDHGTRSICIDDGIDTVDETWEEDALNACSENVAHNQRTSKRIKQKTMNRFLKYGATRDHGLAGYIVPEGAKSYDQWQKDSLVEAIVVEGANMLRSTLNGNAVADYFNDVKYPVGKFAQRKTWDGTMVLRYYRNTTLQGLPSRGKMVTTKHHGSGKRPSKKNPLGPNHYPAPHLAFLDPALQNELITKLAEKNQHFRRKKAAGKDPRAGVPRKRTRFFGQHARCYYCGGHYVWGGNGMTNHLMCARSREWKCWNSIGFDGPLAAEKIVTVITDRLYLLDALDAQFRDMVHNANHGGDIELEQRRAKLRIDEAKFQNDKDNLKSAILQQGHVPLLNELLLELNAREKQLKTDRYALERHRSKPLKLPESTEHLRTLLLEELNRLAIDSFEFGHLIRELVPEIYVYLVRLCDGGHLLPRAKVKLNLLGSIADSALVPGLRELLSTEVTLDLFIPPERERIREQAVRLEARGMKQREISAELVPHPTQTAVFNALNLNRKMKSLELSSPYVFVDSPPDDYIKLRRHKNKKYRFEAVEGYERPTL